MKLLKLNIVVLLSILTLFTACSNFLEESSQDEIIPNTLEDLSAVLYNEAYPYYFSGDQYLNLLTDDVVSNGLQSDTYQTFYDNGMPMFTYNTTMFDGTYTIPDDANSWILYYKKIKGCNVVIDYLVNVNGTEQEKNAIKGQALFLRGYYYLKLATIYCQPYSQDKLDPEKTLGLPLVLSMDVTDEYPKRSSLQQTYDHIESDLKESLSLLKANYAQPSSFRVGYLTAEAMLTRFYVYKNRKEDLQTIVDYSNDVLSNKPSLTYLSSFMSSFHYKGIYDVDISNEPLWVYGTSSLKSQIYFPSAVGAQKVPYSVSPLLTSLYEANDLRAESYFVKLTSYNENYNYRSNKIGLNTSSYGDRGIRNSEVYLNRAEAYCRLFIETANSSYRLKSLNDLNILRESRFETGTYVQVDITDGQDLLNFCLQERRRELCLEEGLRWGDIKRLNLEVNHTFIDKSGNSLNYSLKSGDLLYALPIPYNVMERNSALSQNPR